ncbi:MAG: hypothetical protein ABL882_03400 [Sphingopyxis sp.]
MNWAALAQIGGSLVAILLISWAARSMGLGGDVRIRDEAQARRLANEAVDGFDPVDIVVDRAGIGALLKDAAGRHVLLRRHGAQFVGRVLDNHIEARLDRNFLTIGTGERLLPTLTLDFGTRAQVWAAGLRVLRI